jgi:predicted phage terminase large subunit-like protein
MDPATLAADLAKLPPDMLAYVDWQRRWAATARPAQLPPEGDWSECGYLAGRGFGKTRVGAEWITRAVFEDPSGFDSCVIAPTYQDVRFTCFEGESGILSVLPPELLVEHNKSDMIIRMRNIAGGVSAIRGFTAEKPERLRGPQHTRAWCFIAGTMVTTPDGEQPIETLEPGDLVLTREGPRRVVANASRLADVGAVQIGSAFLIGTADHPVYLPYGWTRMDRLRVGDQACAIVALNGAGSAGTDTAAGITSEQTSPFGPSALSAFTESGGSPKSGRSQTAGTSITETRTKATTPSTILSACLTAITNGTTFFASQSRKITSARASNTPALIAGPVLSARGGCLSQSAGAASNSARTASASSSAHAATAASLSDLGWGLSAARVVSTWRPTGRQSVYCLTVEGEPEYFANGILVHNCDELAAWQYDSETWDMAMMGMRLGQKPQVLWTTTPKPKELIRKLSAPQASRVIVRGSTFDNKANLPDSFFKQLEQYEGTTIGRQELYGELIDPEESGIIRRSWMRLWPAKKPLPPLDYIVMSLDTAFTEATYDRKSGDPDSTACVVMGVFSDLDRAKNRTTNLMLLDCWSEQMGMPDLIKRVKKELNVAYGDDQDAALIKPMFGGVKPITSGRKPDLCLIEDKGSGISLRQMLEREGIEAYAYNPGRADKLARLHMVSHVFARGRVWLPESDRYPGRPRTWVEPMLAQLCAFTGSGSIKHDDFVDSMTQCVRLMLDKGLVSMVKDTPAVSSAPPRKPPLNPYAV